MSLCSAQHSSEPCLRPSGAEKESLETPGLDVQSKTPPRLNSATAFIKHYVTQRRSQFALLLALVTGAAGCSVSVQYAMKFLVDAVALPADGNMRVWWSLAVFLTLIGIESILWRTSGWVGCRLAVGVGVDVRLDLFDYLSGQPMRYFAENLAGSLGQRVTAAAGNMGALINTGAWRIAPPCIDFIGALVIFAVMGWHMAIALAVSVFIIMAVLVMRGRAGRHIHRDYASLAGQAAGELIDSISNMWAVKAFSARGIERSRLASLFGTEAVSQRASWLYIERTRLIHDAFLVVVAGTMLIWALLLWSKGRLTPGEVVVISALTFRILHGSRDLALAMADVLQHFGFIEDTLGIIGQPQTVIDAPGAPNITAGGGEIEFRGVTFAYDLANGRGAVHNVNLHILSGQKVGIVGTSGAGKSTLVQLLQRLHDVEAGEILINHLPIRSIAQDSLRASLAVVPQEISLFHRSIMENIRFGRPEATDTEVFEAARQACCDGFVCELPQGYDTPVGERGVRLSGGQRQRIGIARAFLKRAPVIILDEATSALDSETELAIQHSLLELPWQCTVVAVAHRLSTVVAFDRVIVMEQGRIVEDGPASQLKQRGRHFDRMWRLQTGSPLWDAQTTASGQAQQPVLS